MLATRPATKKTSTTTVVPEAKKPVVVMRRAAKKPAVKPAVATKQKGLLDDDPEVRKYRKLLETHNDVISSTSTINIICEFKPEELNGRKAEALLELAKSFDKEIEDIEKIINKIKEKPAPLNNYEKYKALELHLAVSVFSQYSEWIGSKYKEYQKCKEDPEKTLTVQMNAFKRIYKALYAGESAYFNGYFKDNFMAGREEYSDNLLNADIKKDNSERTKKALALAQKYLGDSKWDNDDLFTEIYKYAFKHSYFWSLSGVMGCSIFRSSKVMEYSSIKAKAEYVGQKPYSRTAKIWMALGYDPKAAIEDAEIENILRNNIQL